MNLKCFGTRNGYICTVKARMACPDRCSHIHVYGKIDFYDIKKKLGKMDMIEKVDFGLNRKMWECEQAAICDNFIPSQIFIDIIGLSIETDTIVQERIGDLLIDNGISDKKVIKSITVEDILQIKNKLIVDNINVPIRTIIKDYSRSGELVYNISMGKFKGYVLTIRPFMNPNVNGLFYHDIDISLVLNLKTAKWYKRLAFMFG